MPKSLPINNFVILPRNPRGWHSLSLSFSGVVIEAFAVGRTAKRDHGGTETTYKADALFIFTILSRGTREQ
jgi:hypothetical protein